MKRGDSVKHKLFEDIEGVVAAVSHDGQSFIFRDTEGDLRERLTRDFEVMRDRAEGGAK